MSDKPRVGTILWHDLTAANAAEVRDFYKAVVGWESSPVSMGDYDDYNMLSPGSESAAAGICHAKGDNASLPAQWMMYIVVDDLDASLDAVQRLGGSVLVPARGEGQRMAVIRDPAGAVAALFQVG